MSALVNIITSPNEKARNTPLELVCVGLSLDSLLAECDALERFRRASGNLYEKVRALFFLHALHRYHIPEKLGATVAGAAKVPYAGYEHLLARRFEAAIDAFLVVLNRYGANGAICSALAVGYHKLAFQTLADQVKRSVRASNGNEWLFEAATVADHPLRIVRPMLKVEPIRPTLWERAPVRMDLSHSGWSDIFFLGMDFPEGARVLNVSIDLSVHGRDSEPRPPVEAWLRVIDQPVIRLTSIDLNASADLANIADVFDFARDYLGLLKAALIASGIVPPAMENSRETLADLLRRIVGPGMGLELVSSVNDIPKGSRLAVSTTLLAALIAVCMRATGQTASIDGVLREDERRLVASRAILGEWLAGSGGGWQDSGGIWPGAKRIEGAPAIEGTPEFGISRGQLLPKHILLSAQSENGAGQVAIEQLQRSLVLVHGGMAQNVGPILEMVTEKYLLRCAAEWEARQRAMQIYDGIVDVMQSGTNVAHRLGDLTTENFFGPITTIIPAATNAYTEALVERVKARFGRDFWGFWMLGGMSGGGMGFIFEPSARATALNEMQAIMSETKVSLQDALPFAMEPVVYDFAVNPHGTRAQLCSGAEGLLPPAYYARAAATVAGDADALRSRMGKTELALLALTVRQNPRYSALPDAFFQLQFSSTDPLGAAADARLDQLLVQNGFDPDQHEHVRADLKTGKIGLAHNRLPASTKIEDVRPGDVSILTEPEAHARQAFGECAICAGEVAVLTLAGGTGSRWTGGAGVTKALNPFVKIRGKHRTFLDAHLAKLQRARQRYSAPIPHIIATSYLTHEPIQRALAGTEASAAASCTTLSPGRAVGLRSIPMARDLRFMNEEVATQLLDEQKQKIRESAHHAILNWARAAGEAGDYRDNTPLQCIHPVGHWYEFANALRNGVLHSVLEAHPALKTILLHNIDTVGVDVSPDVLGAHRAARAALTFEVIQRHLEDRGGGLARVDGRLRLVEGLAMPHEEDEFKLRYYNSNSTWIDLDQTLALFDLTRADLALSSRVDEAVRALAARMPTYITLKDVKKRWGNGHEDVFPVAQWEKLWGDMTGLPEAHCSFVVVPRVRGQQLKDVAQLDGWLRDGSAEYLAGLCGW